jgi:nucleotide-binding universal stress UspA family protein
MESAGELCPREAGHRAGEENMFKHILLPTDGSALASRGVRHGLRLAAAEMAKVTVVYVVPEFRMMADEGFVSPLGAELKARFDRESREYARKVLARAGKLATAAGVRYDAVAVSGDVPHQQILATARKRKCDLIVMSSHGRSGLSSLLLGSETARVLAHVKIPVIVVR